MLNLLPLKKMFPVLLVSIALSACSFVKLTPQGEKARVLSAAEVTHCRLMGKTTSTTTDKVVGIRRHQKAIDEELQALARNEAYKMGGDTIVAEGAEKNGSQTFSVYRCVPQ